MQTVETPKIAVVGYGRHGKDEVGQIISKITRLRYGGSTSWAALPYVANALQIHPQVAWETRHQHRQFWKDYCDWLRRDDPCFLINLVLGQADMVVGIRDKIELDTMRERQLVKTIIWVDASLRVGPEKDPTVTFGKSDADLVLSNNGTLDGLYASVYFLCQSLALPLRGGFIDCMKLIDRPLAPDRFIPERTER